MNRRTAAALAVLAAGAGARAQTSPIRTVFVIVMENHDWSNISGSSSAPYINGQLLPQASHAEAYFNPPGVHPSLPNYLWLEAGTDFGVRDDDSPSAHHWSTDHLVAQLTRAGISWKAYEENIDGTSCPLSSQGNYATQHDPVVYFDDVTEGNNSASAFCIAHVRPYTELAADLQNNTVARYNFITPNRCDDMHSCSIGTADTWLSSEVPRILNSQAYQNGGALFITWDEGHDNDGPIGMIVLSPFAKGNGYANSTHYTHASMLRTMQEIFGLGPFLGGASSASDLGDLFSVALVSSAAAAPQLVNGASYVAGSVAPGEIVSVFGSGIGPAAPAGLVLDGSGMVATALGGVRVLFDSIPAPLLYAGPNQVNLVVPYEVAGKAGCQMQIENQGQSLPALTVTIAQTAPAIFSQNGSGQGAAAVLNQDGSLNSPSNSAAAGSIISVFGTGAGQMDPPAVTGTLAGSTPAQPLQAVSAAIGGMPATVMYAGPAPGLVSGVLQVNLKIADGTPAGVGVPIVLTVGNATSQPGVTISIR